MQTDSQTFAGTLSRAIALLDMKGTNPVVTDALNIVHIVTEAVRLGESISGEEVFSRFSFARSTAAE